MSVWDVERVLGHAWASTTVRYLNPRELHQTGEKSQVSSSRNECEALRSYYALAV